MTNFWNKLPRPFFILAPMEAVSDVVFRRVVAKAGRPDVFFTEFVNATSFCNPKGKESTRDRLFFEKKEQPIIAQIWGTKPDEFEQMCQALAKAGFAGIDINMGCPDKSVIRGGAGSGLIQTPDLACRLISAAKSSGLPVSVKTRLGSTKVEEWHNWLDILLRQDLANLTVHLRTRKEMSKVPAHYELIPEIKKLRDEIAPKTLLTINGDIKNRQTGEELVAKYGIDGVMIGRGVFNNPFAFSKSNRQPSQKDLFKLMTYHLKLHDYYGNIYPRKFDPLKHFFKIYIRDFPGASELRTNLMSSKNTDDVRRMLKEVLH